MVLESILITKDAEKRPELLTIMAIVTTSVAILVSNAAFQSEASMLWIAFVTIAMMPFMVTYFKEYEYEEVTEVNKATSFFDRNAEVLRMYFLFFFGIILATTIWYTVLPQAQNDIVFKEQIATVTSVQQLSNSLTGQFLGLGDSRYIGNTMLIFENNMWVLVLILVTSFLYGAGAIFIVTWNASVIGTFIGNTIKSLHISTYATEPFGQLLAYGHGFYLSLGVLPHGILELAGYTLAAVAGAVVSAATVRRKHLPHEMALVLRDGIILTILAGVLLAIGALLEATAL